VQLAQTCLLLHYLQDYSLKKDDTRQLVRPVSSQAIPTLLEAVEGFRSGRIITLIDDSNTTRPRVALVSPARSMTGALLNRILHLAQGITWVALCSQRAEQLSLPRMNAYRTPPASDSGELVYDWALVSVEAREGVTTGISAADRAQTIRLLGDSETTSRALVQPGHIFPVATRDGGVLVRAALPEAALDLVKMVSKDDSAMFVEALVADGTTASAKSKNLLESRIKEGFSQSAEMEKCLSWARNNQLPVVVLSDLIRYRLETEPLIHRVAETQIPTHAAGLMRSVLYRSTIFQGEHLALVLGDITPKQPVLVRVQPEQTFSDVFGGGLVGQNSRSQIKRALEMIANRKAGILLYLRRAQAGQLAHQISLKGQGIRPPAAARMREYGLGAQVLRDLGAERVEIISNSKQNLVGLRPFGIDIVKSVNF
jgi:3,4-dihydroxy 2-butanone 4-phosphate synthase / GTP cyclohydrolase II